MGQLFLKYQASGGDSEVVYSCCCAALVGHCCCSVSLCYTRLAGGIATSNIFADVIGYCCCRGAVFFTYQARRGFVQSNIYAAVLL